MKVPIWTMFPIRNGASLVLALALSACADVGIRVNYDGLGESPIGEVLASGFPSDEESVNKSVIAEVGKYLPQGASTPDLTHAIERTGLKCDSPDAANPAFMHCRYTGFILHDTVEFIGYVRFGRSLGMKGRVDFEIDLAWDVSRSGTPSIVVKENPTGVSPIPNKVW